jgi:nucleotide-binding universal stress UspA family protein
MFKTIVWATDGSEGADRVLPFAKGLAQGDDRALVAVHAKELLQGERPLHAGEHELEAKIRHQVDEARAEGLDATFRLVTGPASGAAHMIVDVAREVDADLIIVGTRGHTPMVELLLGSVTQRLLHIATCPVLAVPPARQTGVDASEGEAAEAAR